MLKLNMKMIGIAALSAIFAIVPSFTSQASPVTMPDGTVFDAEYYAYMYPEVVEMYKTTDAAVMYEHYQKIGKAEGRRPYRDITVNGNTPSNSNSADPAKIPGSDIFDAAFYAAEYPDVVKAYGSTAPAFMKLHYDNYGKKEGRYPNATVKDYMAKQKALTQSSGSGATSLKPDSLEAQVITIVNEKRAASGLSPLSYDGRLSGFAATRAQEISTNFSHTRPDGTTCFTVIPGDYSYSRAGENIAAGQKSAQGVMNSWMNSQGHRENIMNAGYSKIGVGLYRSGSGYDYYWVQLFAG